MKTAAIQVACLLALSTAAHATEFHVARRGDDTNSGTQGSPFRTIQHAADLAQPGDVITVHEGIYRERINPPRGGESDAKRIVYQAAPGEKVEIRGSEVVKNWVRVQGDVWKASLPKTFFGHFNPYSDLIHGDWFEPKGRPHHTGAVYLNSDWLAEAARKDEVFKPVPKTSLWFAEVDKNDTTIWAQFPGVDPNEQMVEINVRRTVFYPDQPGRNYITVRGFALRHAATPWAPPTAEQVGLVGTHWSKDWIIENNTISHSTCSGIALGKYGDEWDNTSANSAEGYVKTIERALKTGWNKDTIGHHIVRNNTISHCEQAGIVGSLGAVFSVVSGNTIHDIHVRRLFTGAEMAGIKFHAAVDVQIVHNHIYKTVRGIWLDWMAQGTRVSGNLLHDNVEAEDLFVEVDHGPFLVDNNIFLSPVSLTSDSRGGAYVHNLFTGSLRIIPYDARQTPFLKAHSTAVAGLHDNPFGDDRYYNNLFVGPGDLSVYDLARLPVAMEGNVFLKGARPSRQEASPLVRPEFDPAIKLVKSEAGLNLELKTDSAWVAEQTRTLVTTERLGKASVPNLPWEQPDGSPLRLNADYFGEPRNETNPLPGPFEKPRGGKFVLRVW